MDLLNIINIILSVIASAFSIVISFLAVKNANKTNEPQKEKLIALIQLSISMLIVQQILTLITQSILVAIMLQISIMFKQIKTSNAILSAYLYYFALR